MLVIFLIGYNSRQETDAHIKKYLGLLPGFSSVCIISRLFHKNGRETLKEILFRDMYEVLKIPVQFLLLRSLKFEDEFPRIIFRKRAEFIEDFSFPIRLLGTSKLLIILTLKMVNQIQPRD